LAFEQKTNQPITLAADFSRAVIICGKRGSGKSYTMGVIAEELAKQDHFLIILVDPMGVFWSMGLSISDCGLRISDLAPPDTNSEIRNPQSEIKVNILVPGDPAERYSPRALARMRELGVQINRISLDPAALSAEAWCELFNISMSQPLGICLYRAVRNCQKRKGESGKGKMEGGRGKTEKGQGSGEEEIHSPPSPFHSPFSIKDLMRAVESDGQAADVTRQALINRLDMADQWGIFAQACPEPGRRDGELEKGLKVDHVNVLDLSIIDPGLHGLRNLLVALLCRDLFAQRIRARREEELGLIDLERRVWLLIDEAHQFVPTGRASIAKDVLIRWVKEGRQPGLSLVAVSQQPGAIDADLLSQCDLLVIHKLTAQEDLTAVSRLGQTYIRGDLKVYLKQVRNTGEVVIVDDHAERLWMGKVRERETRHAGGELPLAEIGGGGEGGTK
ncbi:MAG: ATP-binding protein, partial [Acidobacteriota bacterium]